MADRRFWEQMEYLDVMRAGGAVRRFHTCRFMNMQTVAEHSYGVAVMCLALTNREASARLLRAALQHDVEEQETGDLPFPAKRQHGVLRQEIEKLERQFRVCHGLEELSDLSTEDRLVLSWADLLEMWFTCHEQVRMGNQFAQAVQDKAMDALCGLPDHPVGTEMLRMIRGGLLP